VGFSDAQTFQRAFQRRLGAKPRSYLKNSNAISIMSPLTKTQHHHQ
jgi:AraC-like DNA-binding protein